MLTELTPIYESRKSFYQKAYVDSSGIYEKSVLVSYGTRVAGITKQNKVVLLPKWDYSPTTLRHVKEYLKQNGFKAETKKQMFEDYAYNKNHYIHEKLH